MPSAAAQSALALQFQLDQTQWWSAADLERHQLQQLECVLRHAYDRMPFWHERLAAARFDPRAALSREWFATLPPLTRDEVQTHGESLLCRDIPRDHGPVAAGQTSGSTGKPIVYYSTGLAGFYWRALTLRDQLWHGRELSGKLAAIRIRAENEVVGGWGPALDVAFETGPCATLDIRTDIDVQLSWLEAEDPDYLITHPSILRALVLRARSTGYKPRRLREVRTFAEMLPADLRGLCREIWNVRLTDVYSAREVGYIALQCPRHEHYHVQSEDVLVEVLNDANARCDPGEAGRVVVTPLHNFAMPLIRYEIGDYAQPGGVCPCGRGLQVIERIMGRARNVLRTPDGRRYHPAFRADDWMSIAPIRQLQVVQHDLNDIEIRIVAERPLTAVEEASVAEAFQETLAYPFRIRFTYVERIERSAGFKFEDFISHLEA